MCAAETLGGDGERVWRGFRGLLQSWSTNMGTCWLFCLAASALSSGRAAEEERRKRKRERKRVA